MQYRGHQCQKPHYLLWLNGKQHPMVERAYYELSLEITYIYIYTHTCIWLIFTQNITYAALVLTLWQELFYWRYAWTAGTFSRNTPTHNKLNFTCNKKKYFLPFDWHGFQQIDPCILKKKEVKQKKVTSQIFFLNALWCSFQICMD